jgi:hypothetical protein
VFQHVAISRHIGPDERGTAFGIIGVEKVYVAGERETASDSGPLELYSNINYI